MDYEVGSVVVLFGGCGATCPLGDTWEFAGGTWTKLSPTTSPAARYGASMAFDLRDGYSVLFGGCGTAATGCSATALYGDTWEFSTGTWTQVGSCGGPSQPACASGTAPAPRYLAMISCPITVKTQYGIVDDVELAGGTTGAVSSTTLSDLWTFLSGTWYTGGTWSSIWSSSPSPSPRFDGDFLDEAASADAYFAFGGSSPSGTSLGDTEVLLLNLNYFPTQWPPVMPSPRAGFSLAYDQVDQVVVMFGGCGNVCPMNQTWIYGECGVVIPLMKACPQSLYDEMAWENVTATSGPPPAARTNAAMGYDPASANPEVLLFGGENASGVPLGDLWSFKSATGWSHLPCAGTCPQARFDASMSNYTGGGASGSAIGVVLFGGIGSAGVLLGDTWFYGSGSWSQVTSSPAPSARYGAGMSSDSSSGAGIIVLFGGSTSIGQSQQTWELSGSDISALRWSDITPTTCTSSTCPSAEAGGGMTYDSNDGYVVLFENGNASCPIAKCWSTWSFQSGGWTQVGSPPSCLPTCNWPLTSAPIAYSGSANYVVLFGGGGPNSTLTGSLYAWGNAKWVSANTTNPMPLESGPVPLVGASMVYDPTLSAVILVGGCYGFACTPPSTQGMWAFQNGSWRFVPLDLSGSDAPDVVAFASIGYYAAGNEVILFGGLEIPSLIVSSSTWRLQGSTLAGATWTRLSNSGSPAARWGAAMAYDAQNQYLVMFGGCGVTWSYTGVCSTLLSDTWEYSGGWVSGPSGPSSRFGAAMAPTILNGGGVLLVGGWSSGSLSDQWHFLNGAWTHQGSTSAPARWGAMMDFDTLNDELVLFGGFADSSKGELIADNDTWVQNSGGSWVAAGGSYFGSAPRGFGCMKFDPLAGGDGWVLTTGGVDPITRQVQGNTTYFAVTSGWIDVSEWS